ncbi:CpaD family pilus assembly protein [Roseibium salinum]|uniref:CpaD family pilus assembly protein n=1 Tax=Roseibium salinum TaxID=1604349 RepID=A0ABT3R4P4_9HYPH|nr:CpaD family pilus assembly protein [Roseibium sp. DSM 29163]MCX2724139.1 CpaD family pilus assembly protein [Roseibium sp. DSM 29163]MDN3721800.1 CpaD family pilus assembly protein [Roseibium salinum]
MNKQNTVRIAAASKSALVLFGCLVIAGCQSQSQPSAQLLASNDYRLRHPIVVTEEPETLDLPIGRNTRALYGPIEDTITAFAAQSQQDGNGAVEILVPSGGANEAAVHAVTDDIRSALQRGGLGRSRISTRTYRVGDPSADAPIRLSYARMQATAGPCGSWPRNIGGGVGENASYENFGCATQSNLAMMVENPSDLLTPRASTPVDQNRRAVVIENYRKGDVTGGTYKEGVGAEVAE